MVVALLVGCSKQPPPLPKVVIDPIADTAKLNAWKPVRTATITAKDERLGAVLEKLNSQLGSGFELDLFDRRELSERKVSLVLKDAGALQALVELAVASGLGIDAKNIELTQKEEPPLHHRLLGPFLILVESSELVDEADPEHPFSGLSVCLISANADFMVFGSPELTLSSKDGTTHKLTNYEGLESGYSYNKFYYRLPESLATKPFDFEVLFRLQLVLKSNTTRLQLKAGQKITEGGINFEVASIDTIAEGKTEIKFTASWETGLSEADKKNFRNHLGKDATGAQIFELHRAYENRGRSIHISTRLLKGETPVLTPFKSHFFDGEEGSGKGNFVIDEPAEGLTLEFNWGEQKLLAGQVRIENIQYTTPPADDTEP